ncbi:MAG TPA: hypothetical protein VKB12_05735 [Pyrinomonadaceae bacterium]|nr:hypothetical protein [Pyrinomonadaceae bacterium]
MSFKLKLVTVSVALTALAGVAGAQEREYAEPPELKLTQTVEKTFWRAGEPAHVRVRIENASGGSIEIPSNVSFMADNRSREDGWATTSHGVFWSPVSLTKTYSVRGSQCQNDLTPDRVKTPKGGKVVEIHPAKDKLTLGKGEAKEFSFDLAGTCWGHSIQAFYPDSTIFEAAGRYKSNSYRVYFLMQFRMRTGDPKDVRNHQLKSNAVEVTIN